VLYLLVLLLLVALVGQYAARWWGGSPIRKLQPGDRIAYRVDINAATAAELDLLPGVGPTKAAAIVAYRDRHGHLASVQDLAKVPGMNARLVENLKELIFLRAPAPEGGSPR
jgi:competence ComEA-like helix-hairpin-helix protein